MSYHDEIEVVPVWEPKKTKFVVLVEECLIGILGLVIIRVRNFGDHVIEGFKRRAEHNDARVEFCVGELVPPDIRGSSEFCR